MKFHEAVAAMANGECVQNNSRHEIKLNDEQFCYWNGCNWLLCYKFDSHDLLSTVWKIVPDPSINPLTFSEAMKAIEEGKAVRSCIGSVYFSKNGCRTMVDGEYSTYGSCFQVREFEKHGQWHIVPVPEVK